MRFYIKRERAEKRVKIKRELRKRNIPFKISDSTKSLKLKLKRLIMFKELTERENLAKLQLLCDKITNQSRELLRFRDLDCEVNLLNAKATYKIKKKYTYIDVGNSGKYLINEDGEIFGIKKYGVINKGRFYGILDTVDDYYWGDYTARKITQNDRDFMAYMS